MNIFKKNWKSRKKKTSNSFPIFLYKVPKFKPKKLFNLTGIMILYNMNKWNIKKMWNYCKKIIKVLIF
jgi:hypothetical protein